MWNKGIRNNLTSACMMALMMSQSMIPSQSLQIGGPKGGKLGDLLTASIIGLVVGGVRNRVKQQKNHPIDQPKTSANHHRPMFMPSPWRGALLHQYPIMHPIPMMPTFTPHMIQPNMIQPNVLQSNVLQPNVLQSNVLQPNMIQTQPFIQDTNIWLGHQWNDQQAFAPMATQIMQTVLAQPPMQAGLQEFNGIGVFNADISSLQQQWQALESQAIGAILAYNKMQMQ